MKSRPAFKLATLASLLLMIDSFAFADVLPGAALPEQVSKALTSEQPVPQTRVLPPIAVPEQKPASPLGPEAEKIKFKLNGIILEGNRTYSTTELSKIYQNQIGKEISVAELFNIVQNITNYYRNNGYIITRAILPPQHVKNGVVRIQIIEGYIGDVTVTGKPNGACRLVQAYGNNIKRCPPLELANMERYLILANEIPSTEVRAVLSPSKTKTGAADLTLVTQNQPIVGYFSYDNYGTRYIGPQQMTANLGINSSLISGDSTQFTFTKTPKGKELTYGDINYNMPVGTEGVRWYLGGTGARTHPLFVLQPLHIEGTNENYYTNLQYPLIRTRSKSLTLQGGFNYLDSHVTTFDTELYTDHLRSLGFGVNYTFADSYGGSNLVFGEVRQGLPILGYTSDTSINALTSRPGGHAVYTKLDFQLSRLQAIKGPFSLYGLVKGQYGFEALLASEQFTFGGSQLGRGYDVAELIGDRGYAGSLEARYDLGVGKLFIQALQFYVFYDLGMAWNFDTSTITEIRQSATSTGFGVRFYFTKSISGNFMWTQPLTKQVAAEELIGQGKAPRMFFSVVAQF